MPCLQGPACVSLGEVLQGQRGSLLQPTWGTRHCWGGPISQRIQLKDTQQAGPPHPQLKPLQHSSWQPGACAALGDPLASCPPLASVHQPSEGLKHLQEPARLASRSGSVPSPLPPSGPSSPDPLPSSPKMLPSLFSISAFQSPTQPGSSLVSRDAGSLFTSVGTFSP